MKKLDRKDVTTVLNSMCINNFFFLGKVHWLSKGGVTNTFHEKGQYVTTSEGAVLGLKTSRSPFVTFIKYLRAGSVPCQNTCTTDGVCTCSFAKFNNKG